jgi:hypothetical protein
MIKELDACRYLLEGLLAIRFSATVVPLPRLFVAALALEQPARAAGIQAGYAALFVVNSNASAQISSLVVIFSRAS